MKKKVLSLLLVAAMGISMLVGCGGGSDTDTENKPNNNTENDANTEAEFKVDEEAIKNLVESSKDRTVELELWCSELPAYQEVMAEVVKDFQAEYPDVTFNITIGAQSEASAKDRVLEDPEAAADVFVFADDQIGDLVKAGALREVVKTYTFDVAKENVAGTVEASTVDGKLYAYPLTASNGYFLFYDSRYLSEEDVQSWESLVAAAESKGLQVGMDVANAWYLYGFFAGAGCELSRNEDGSNSCNWNNAAGLATAKSVMSLCSSSSFISINDETAKAQVVTEDNKLVAYVDGTWAADAFKTGYAEGYSATKLPTFKVDGKDVQMSSYAGYKLVGVSSYSQETGWAMLLAEFITSEASQTKIGVTMGESPANIKAATNEAFADNVALVALSEQSAYADQQIVGDSFWAPAAALGQILVEGTTTDLQKDLDDAVAGITQAVE